MTHQHLPHPRRKGVDKVWTSYSSAESRLAKIVFASTSSVPYPRFLGGVNADFAQFLRHRASAELPPSTLRVSQCQNRNRRIVLYGMGCQKLAGSRRCWYAKQK